MQSVSSHLAEELTIALRTAESTNSQYTGTVDCEESSCLRYQSQVHADVEGP
jgi:hypothetical protein